MLAQRRDEPFDSPEFLYEIKWDGYRCLAFVDGGVFLQSRSGLDMSGWFPELAADVTRAFGGRRVIVDGEIVAWRQGRPDFGALQERARKRRGRAARAAAAADPVSLVVFDLLHVDGRDLIQLPCEERRLRLRSLLPAGGAAGLVVFSEQVIGSGRRFYEATARAGLEGIVAKRRDSPYRPGRRSPDWLKVPHEHRLLCVIGGVTSGGHYGIGALLVGAYDPARPERLTYLGHVGTGFDRRRLGELATVLTASPRCPFHEVPPDYRVATWVRPDRVCLVGYRELTRDRRLRHAVYRGLEPAADPAACLVPWAGPAAGNAGAPRPGVDVRLAAPGREETGKGDGEGDDRDGRGG